MNNTLWALESDCLGSNIQFYPFSCFRMCTSYLNFLFPVSSFINWIIVYLLHRLALKRKWINTWTALKTVNTQQKFVIINITEKRQNKTKPRFQWLKELSRIKSKCMTEPQLECWYVRLKVYLSFCIASSKSKKKIKEKEKVYGTSSSVTLLLPGLVWHNWK